MEEALIRFDPNSSVSLSKAEEAELFGRLAPLTVTLVSKEAEDEECAMEALLARGPMVAVWLRHYS
jgi:hypothetical protein